MLHNMLSSAHQRRTGTNHKPLIHVCAAMRRQRTYNLQYTRLPNTCSTKGRNVIKIAHCVTWIKLCPFSSGIHCMYICASTVQYALHLCCCINFLSPSTICNLCLSHLSTYICIYVRMYVHVCQLAYLQTHTGMHMYMSLCVTGWEGKRSGGRKGRVWALKRGSVGFVMGTSVGMCGYNWHAQSSGFTA